MDSIEIIVRALPSIITVLVGGIAANFLFPRVQAESELLKSAVKTRLLLLDRFVEDFSAYHSAAYRWHHYVQPKPAENPVGNNDTNVVAMPKPKIADAGPEHYVTQRDQKRDQLFATILLCRQYFSVETIKILDDFSVFEYRSSNQKPGEQRFDNDGWTDMRDRIVEQLKTESFVTNGIDGTPVTRNSIKSRIEYGLGVRARQKR